MGKVGHVEIKRDVFHDNADKTSPVMSIQTASTPTFTVDMLDDWVLANKHLADLIYHICSNECRCILVVLSKFTRDSFVQDGRQQESWAILVSAHVSTRPQHPYGEVGSPCTM